MKRLGICQNEIGTRLGVEALGRMKGTLPRIQLGSRRILQCFNDLSDISALFWPIEITTEFLFVRTATVVLVFVHGVSARPICHEGSVSNAVGCAKFQPLSGAPKHLAMLLKLTEHAAERIRIKSSRACCV
jgi:hypothetical protein